MNLIEILLYLQERDTKSRQEEMDRMGVASEFRKAIQQCFDDIGNLVGADGRLIIDSINGDGHESI
jgi:hypothetical protein